VVQLAPPPGPRVEPLDELLVVELNFLGSTLIATGTVEAHLLGEEDGGHRAGAELPLDLVARDVLAGLLRLEVLA
jgi:hypothetical protein